MGFARFLWSRLCCCGFLKINDAPRIATLSSTPISSRFRSFIFRRRSPSRLLPSSQPFVASGRKSLPRLYLPSSQPFVDSFRRRLHLPSSQPFVDSFRRRSLSSIPSVVAALRRLQLRVASATLASVAASQLRPPAASQTVGYLFFLFLINPFFSGFAPWLAGLIFW